MIIAFFSCQDRDATLKLSTEYGSESESFNRLQTIFLLEAAVKKHFGWLCVHEFVTLLFAGFTSFFVWDIFLEFRSDFYIEEYVVGSPWQRDNSLLEKHTNVKGEQKHNHLG